MTSLHPDVSKALALLATGHTMQAAAERVGWPVPSVRALAKAQRGWLISTSGRVYTPDRPTPHVPDGVLPTDLAWARQLRTAAAASTSPAGPKRSVKGGNAIDGQVIVDLPIRRIRANPRNIRKDIGDVSELAASVRAHGLLQPLTVRPHPTIAGEYELLAGHRRHAAALQAGLARVPAVIRHVDDAVAVEVMLVENVQRRDLNPIEKAEALGKLRARGYSNTLISIRTGIAESTVSYLLALLELDPAGREKVRSGEITVGEAVAAVRRLRRKLRKGQGSQRSRSWEPDHFTSTHPLAAEAAQMCEAQEHTTRRRVGKVACGQCWEDVIRTDERNAIDTENRKATAS